MIISFTGYSGVGKDAAAQFLINECGYTRVAFADPLREMLYALNPIVGYKSRSGIMIDVKTLVDELGWDEAKRKHQEVRELLQRLGTEAGRNILGANIWVDTAIRKVEALEKVVITDVRFPNEACAILNKSGIVVRITRQGYAPINDHISDAGLGDYWISHTIENDGTLEDLREKIMELV